MDKYYDILRDINEYNKEPVHYCKHCLSLKIRVLGEDTDFCDNCGSTDTEITDITSWEIMYENQYGKKFLD